MREGHPGRRGGRGPTSIDCDDRNLLRGTGLGRSMAHRKPGAGFDRGPTENPQNRMMDMKTTRLLISTLGLALLASGGSVFAQRYAVPAPYAGQGCSALAAGRAAYANNRAAAAMAIPIFTQKAYYLKQVAPCLRLCVEGG